MTPWDDVEIDSDGDEMLDWLWDLPDRYDVGMEDDPTAPGAVVATPGRVDVRKRVRRPGGATEAGEAEELGALLDDRPTQAVDALEPDADYQYDYPATMFAPALGRDRWIDRYTARERAIAAAVFLVVLVVAGIGYAVINSGSGKSPKPSNLAIGPATTTATTLAGVIASPGTAPAVTDSTVPPDTTTTAPPTTDASVPAFGGGFTTTTVAHQSCVFAIACFVLTQVTTTTSPGTTVPHTTTTVAATTTTPPPATTTSTAPATTTTAPATTTTKPTTTTTVASTTTTVASTTTSTPAPTTTVQVTTTVKP